MQEILTKLKNKNNLSFEESKNAFSFIMDGKANEDEMYKFLTLLTEKGEVSDEIAGGVYVLRNKAKRVNVKNCVDTCGTGGDGKNTLNISTASALLLASMGIKVAKHGNKAVSSKCGSGDVLEALNVKINLEPKDVENQINKNNFGFMFAPNYHSAMKYVVTQKLFKKKDGSGRVGAFEVMVCNAAIKNLIREAKVHQIPSVMQTGQREGMITMEKSIEDLIGRGDISNAEKNS